MSERDELASVIVAAYGEDAEVECPCEQDLDVADAILAAGYRKPWTITSAEEVAGLATGTVLLSEQGGVWIAYDHLGWREPGVTRVSDDYDIALPATVLWEPQP